MKKNAASTAAVAVGVVLLLFLAGEITIRLLPFPELESFSRRKYSTVITDRNGEILRILPLQGGVRREYLPLQRMPPEAARIFVESEDRRFFSHRGVDGFAVLRSMFLNRQAGRTVSGASTISMQLAGIVKPREPDLRGKLLEAWDAIRLEAKCTKSEILEYWLNSLSFGRQAEGIASGSRAYFNTPVDGLRPAELAVLALIPRHPRKYDPLTNPEEAFAGARRNSERLSIQISAEKLRRAAASADAGNSAYHAPHFLAQIERRLHRQTQRPGGRRAGLSAGTRPPEGPGSGEVKTALDLKLQQHLHRLLYTYQQRYAESRISSAAGILIDNHTGEVLAYVGSLDFFSGREGEQLDGLTTVRQPGSCLKPFLYAAALEEGWLPNMLLPDVPMEFGGREMYVPMNFNNSFSGPVRLRTALGSSLNVPAVYLLKEIGIEAFGGMLTDAGFSLEEEKLQQAGLGSALGNFEVSLLEMTRGFALFPRRGVPLELVWFSAAASGGDTFEAAEQAVSRYTADLVCDILSDPAARAPGFAYNSAFRLPFPAMFKTGTSDQFQNIWALAATPDYTAGVWMGNNTGQTVVGRTGSSVPARIAAEILSIVQQGSPEFPEPAGAVPVEICAVSGGRATELCPSVITEYLPAEAAGPPSLGPCTFHVLRNGRVIAEYPEKYHAWIRELGRSEKFAFSGGEGITILHPNNGAVYYYDPSVPAESQALRIEAVPGSPGACTLLINGEAANIIHRPPYVWFLPLEPGRWELTVSNKYAEDSVKIEVR